MPEYMSVAQKDRRRDTARYVSRLKIPGRIRCASEEGQWVATIRNISQQGIGLVSNRPFKIGMVLTVELPVNPPNPAVQQRLVRVTHSKALPGNQWWMLGGVFIKKMTRVEVDALRSRSPAILPRAERRTNVRHTTRVKAPCPVVRATEEGLWWATVRNVSYRGISLISNRPFKVGMFLTVELPTQTHALGKPRLLQVVYCEGQPGGEWFTLGCTFLTKLSREEMESLR